MLVMAKSILLIIALFYVGYGAYFLLAQRSMLYHPNFPTKGDFHNCPAFDDSEKVNMNGTRAYYKHAGESIVVMYGGNAGSACDRSYLKVVFDNAGHSYLFVEYAGYGGDTKKPSRKLLLKDAENVVSFLKEKEYKRTILFAESIGTGVASYHASLLPPDKMIFIAPFDKLSNVAKSHFPFSLYPMNIMAKFSTENFDNIPHLLEYRGALTIIHGTKDRIIPIKHGKALFEKVPTENKNFVAIEGAGHNDIYNFDEMWHAVNEALK